MCYRKVENMKRLYSKHLHSYVYRHFSMEINLAARSVDKSHDVLGLKYVNLIQEATGCPRHQVIKTMTLWGNTDIQLLEERMIVQKLKLLRNMGLQDEKSLSIIPLLITHHLKLINRHTVLCEYGFRPELIAAIHIKRFISICKTPVIELKKKGFIGRETNVMEHLWSCAGLNMSKCPQMSDDDTLYSLKHIALEQFLLTKLGVSERIYKEEENNFIFRFQNKSFQTINTNLMIFKDIIGLSPTRLITNWYVLHTSPENTMDMINNIKEIGNIDMKLCLNVCPKITEMTVDNMKKILQYVEEAGISKQALQRCVKIFTLNCETVKNRIQELKDNDFLSISYNHPRIVEAIFSQVKATKRIKLLEELQIYCAGFNRIINTTQSEFERFCEVGGRPSGVDSLYYLKAELQLEKQELVAKLRRHPRWCYVPVVHLGKNLQLLRTMHSDTEIKQYIYILFYYCEKLKRTLQSLDDREGIEIFKEDGRVKKEYVLPLTLYFLENESNFTGESIWDVELNPYQDLPDSRVSKQNYLS